MNDFQRGDSIYRQATQLREEREFEKAVESYREALQILDPIVEAPLKVCIFYDMALAFDLNGKRDSAIESFNTAVDLFYEFEKQSSDEEAVSNMRGLVFQIEEHLKMLLEVAEDAEDYLSCIKARPWSRDDMPIGVYVDESDATGFDSKLADLVWKAFTLWLYPGVKIGLSRKSFIKQASIVVRKVDDRIGPAAGQTLFNDREDSDGRLWLTDVSISMFVPEKEFSKLSESQMEKFFSLACHEAGHALGIDGHSPYGGDLMYFKSPLVNPSVRDLKTLSLIYQ